MKHDIFLSYQQTDREFAAQLVRELDRQGISVWYDAEVGGRPEWRDDIQAALETSGMMVVLFSEAANETRQLGEHLAAADSLGKPVVPVLIENCRPKGTNLHTLADRNWIEAWPEPHTRIADLVVLLAALAGKGPAPEAAPSPAPTMASAYVGMKDKRLAQAAKRSDILPFVWLDLVALVPVLGVFGLMAWSGAPVADLPGIARPAFVLLSCVALLGLYGAVAFPARYYLRSRPVSPTINSYLASNAILLAIALLLLAIVLSQPRAPDLMPAAVQLVSAWVALSVIAFTAYGVFAGQRARVRFTANLRPL